MARKFAAQAESTRIGDTTFDKSRRSALNRTPTGTPRRQSPTVSMVQAALQDLEASNRKGITLQAIKKYICSRYEITLTVRRKNLIGDYLRSLLHAGDLKNLSGKGLNGHLRYMTKEARIGERKSRGKQANPIMHNKTLNAPLRPTKASFHTVQTTLLLETPKSTQTRKRYASEGLPNLNCSDIEPEEPQEEPRPRLRPKRRRLFGIDNI